ncbi:response regulator transcription factor [Ascidiimonas aurantiaca]|uniref:response regulator transcription factor n=1 Tax=Ascidiimonas aurantiaca TaxID=1685432 RepID=UPI0030ED7C46
MYKLLLVEDDRSLGYLLSEYLKMKGFLVSWAENGKQAMVLINEHIFDLAILDVMMPDINGFELGSRIHLQHSDLPFLFLTARSLKIDVLKGFSVGAVDYLKKPIDEEELVVRIRALLSRLDKTTAFATKDTLQPIGKYTLNVVNQELIHEEQRIKLTARESTLLSYLASRKDQLCTYKELLTGIWGKNDYFNKKSLNVYISHLRKHLRKDTSLRIENVHGQGFILRTDI